MTQKQKQTIEAQNQIIKELQETIKKQHKKPSIYEQGFKTLYKKQWDKVIFEIRRSTPNKYEHYSVRITSLRTNHELSMYLEDWEAENLMLALRKEFTIVPEHGKPYLPYDARKLKNKKIQNMSEQYNK